MKVLSSPAGKAVKIANRDHELHQFMILALMVAKDVIEDPPYEMWLTSGVEGTHMLRSLHPKGKAIDIDVVPNPPDSIWNNYLNDIKEQLHPMGFDVVLSKKRDGKISHIHIEWDPK